MKRLFSFNPKIFAICIFILAVLSLAASMFSPLSKSLRKQESVLGLLVGTDWVDNARHADTMVLFRYNPAQRSLDLLSVPRDTRIEVPGLKIRRMNEVYAYAFRANNRNHDAAIHELTRIIRSVLFASPKVSTEPGARERSSALPEINYYVQIDYDAFRKIINLLGGVTVTIDEPMNYDDNWGKLHIHFNPGQYVLDGQKALEYVRYRGHSGDYGRVVRQQQFVLKILDRFKNPLNLLKIPKILFISIPSIKTNLNAFEKFLILWELKDLRKEQIRMMQLPGRAQNGFWIPDSDGLAATAQILSGQKRVAPVKSVLNGALAPADAPKSDSLEETAKPLTVEVWNASSKKGLALDVVRYLRGKGFDVVKWGNYKSRQPRTLVRDHRGDMDHARAIASALNAPRVEIFTHMESNPLVDVEVILGEDYSAEKK